MPRLRIFFDVEGWAFHRRALALKQYAPADYEVTISPWSYDGDEPDLGDVQPDVIFFLPSRRLVRLHLTNGRVRYEKQMKEKMSA